MKKVVLSTLLLVSVSSADVPHKGVTALSAQTRSLLSQEMQHIEKGMKQIFSYMIRGDYESITPIANDIRDSFIFKKKLTKEQRLELKDKLPKEFIELDSSFHKLAGELANGSEFEEKDKVIKTFNQMSRKCIKCHSTYAKHRFFKE